MSRILLVEDDESLGETLKTKLEREGMNVLLATTKKAAKDLIDTSKKEFAFDCCVLDVGLPDGSGLDLGRDIRLYSEVPIIFLSAMSSAEYRLEGFELGADDYVPKPFHFKELLLRIQRSLEQKNVKTKTSFEHFQIDDAAMAIIDHSTDKKSFLTELDYKVFIFLIRNSNRAVTRDELLSLWTANERETARTVDNAIVRIRQALGKAAEVIRSVRGVGYQFVG